MAFIDNLAFLLFSVSFAGFILLYTASSMYLVYRSKKRNYIQHLQGASIPMLLIGLYLVFSGFAGQLTWPLPGSYNILYFDPIVALGLLMVAFALAIRFKVNLEYAGFFGLLVGVMALLYGIKAYSIGLSSEPLAVLVLYMFYGIAGIFSFPAALIADRLPFKSNPKLIWHVLLLIFWLALLLASLTSGYIGYSAIGGHLVSAP